MVRIQVSFVLLIYDEFNGTAITDAGILFKINGRLAAPIRKNDGYYVFLAADDSEWQLETEHRHYFPYRRLITRDLNGKPPIISIRLIRRYPGVFSDCAWVAGTGPPESSLLAFAGADIRLQAVNSEGNARFMSETPASMLLGKRFAQEKESGNTFIIVPAESKTSRPGMYTTEDSVPAVSGEVHRAYLSRCGADGQYFIPVEKGGENMNLNIICREKGGGPWVLLSATGRS